MALRLGVNTVGEETAQIRKQSIPAVILDLGGFQTAANSFIPVLAPIVGVARTDPVGKLTKSVHERGGEVCGVRRRSVVQACRTSSTVG